MSRVAAHKALTRYLRSGHMEPETLPALRVANTGASARLAHVEDLAALPSADRVALRLDIYLVAETLNRMQKAHQLPAGIDPKLAAGYQKSLKQLTNFIPLWVKIAVALARTRDDDRVETHRRDGR